MVHRRIIRVLAVAATGLGLALAPLSMAAASRTTTTTSHHASSGSACSNLKKEESASSALGTKVANALASGNFAKAKLALIKAYNADIKNDTAAIAVLEKAPNNVKTAFNGVIGFARQVKQDIVKAKSEKQLISQFTLLSGNAQLLFDSDVIANWVTKTCGSISPSTAGTTTTSS